MPTTLPVSWTTVSLMFVTLPDLGSATTLTSAHLAHFAGRAQSIAEAKIVRHYSLPLAGDVPILQTVTTDLAIYQVLAQRLFTAERLNQSPWPDRYRESMDILDRIADGTIPLVDASGAVLGARTDVAEVYSTTKDYHPTFWDGGGSSWTDQVVDEDKIEDEADRRDLNPFPRHMVE